MLRRLFTVLSALSLLLCVAAAVLWVRSRYIEDWVSYQPRDVTAPVPWHKEFSLHSTAGGITLVWWTDRHPLPASAARRLRHKMSNVPTFRWRRTPARDLRFSSDLSPLWHNGCDRIRGLKPRPRAESHRRRRPDGSEATGVEHALARLRYPLRII